MRVDETTAAAIDAEREVPEGSEVEVEIRVATIVAGEAVRKAAEKAAGRAVTVSPIDLDIWRV